MAPWHLFTQPERDQSTVHGKRSLGFVPYMEWSRNLVHACIRAAGVAVPLSLCAIAVAVQNDAQQPPKKPALPPLGAPEGAEALPAPAADTPPSPPRDAKPALEETRLALGKWIETQQIISKERNEWQQGKEILRGRIELVSKEIALLKEKIAQSESAVSESNKKRDELVAENDALKAVATQLNSAVTALEDQIRKLAKLMPEPVTTKMAPLMQRIPTDSAAKRVSTAERFQNVLGVLNELNKANSEITVAYEIRTLADGTSSEVQVIYVGLAQAYYLSPRGEAGVGRPSEGGWKWQPAPEASNDILLALEIIQGKHSPAFVSLPLTIQE